MVNISDLTKMMDKLEAFGKAGKPEDKAEELSKELEMLEFEIIPSLYEEVGQPVGKMYFVDCLQSAEWKALVLSEDISFYLSYFERIGRDILDIERKKEGV